MYSRMYGPLRKNAVWMINQEIEPQLFTMSWEGSSSSVPAYLPASQAGINAPVPQLFGRPVITSQACSALGDQGDIIFASWPQYLAAVKSSGLQSDISIHLWFDYDVSAFRFVFRVGGQCLWSSDIDSLKGADSPDTSNLGAFITLDERS
jgi:HK97 family phage major capsid protein